MSGKKFFQIDPENQPNRTTRERVVSERGRKELPPGTKGGENLKPDRHYEHKQYAFDSYCKKVLKCEACNGYRQISRHQKRFTSLEELSEADVAQLAVYDRYSWEYTAFPVGNAVVLIENDRLATALLRLSPKDREIFMMHWFLWMTDEQIAKCIIEERLRDVKAKIEQRTSAVMALAVTEETRTDVKKIRTEVRKELEGYEAQRMAVKKAIMTPYEQFEAVYKECVSNPYKAADEALGKKIADVEVGIKQQKEDDVRAFFNELTSGFGLDWLKFEQMNLKVTLTCTPKAMKAAITQSVTKIVRDCAALEENPDRDEIMVEYQKSLDLGSACQIVQQRHKQLEAQRRAAEERRARQQAQQEAEAKARAAIEAEAAKREVEQPAPPHEVATPPQAESPAQAPAAAPAPTAARAEKKYLAKFAVTGTLPQLKALKAFMEKEGMQYDTIS